MFSVSKELAVLKVEKKVSQKGKPYHRVTLGGLGFSFSTFLPDALVPDFVEGETLGVDLEITFREGRPDLRIVGRSR